MPKEGLEKELKAAKKWVVISGTMLVILTIGYLLPIYLSGKSFFTYISNYVDKAAETINISISYPIYLVLSPILFLIFLVYFIYGIWKYFIIKRKQQKLST